MRMLCVGLAIAVLSGCTMMLDSQNDARSKQLDQGGERKRGNLEDWAT